LFVLGRPGSGKSTAVSHIHLLAERKGYRTANIRVSDILHQIFMDDTEGKFRPEYHDSFDIIVNARVILRRNNFDPPCQIPFPFTS